MPVGEPRTVPARLSFLSSANGVIARLVYGGTSAGDTDDCGARGVSNLTVTRLPQYVWQVASGPTACFYVGAVFQGIVNMPIAFTLTALSPVP
jgi:hypothetical protein